MQFPKDEIFFFKQTVKLPRPLGRGKDSSKHGLKPIKYIKG